MHRIALLTAILCLAAGAPLAFAQDRQQERAAKPPPASGAEADRRACEEQKKRFMESQACFQKFRLVNGAVRPEAHQHCTEVKQPRGC
jgi:hypothetical protein